MVGERSEGVKGGGGGGVRVMEKSSEEVKWCGEEERRDGRGEIRR